MAVIVVDRQRDGVELGADSEDGQLGGIGLLSLNPVNRRIIRADDEIAPRAQVGDASVR